MAAQRVQVHEEVLRLLLAAAPQLPVPQLAGYLQVGPLLRCIGGSAHRQLPSLAETHGGRSHALYVMFTLHIKDNM